MGEIGDPIVLRFVAERVRPLAECIRGLRHELLDAQAEWQGGVKARVAKGPDIVKEPRESVRPLSAADVHTNMDCHAQLLADLALAGVLEALIAACVRPLEVCR